MPTLKALIQETDPIFLGGVEGKHLANTTYGNLVRSRNLPPLVITSRKDDNMSPRVETLLKSLSTGKDLSISWSFRQGVLSLEAYYTGDGFVLSDPLGLAMFSCISGYISLWRLMWRPLETALHETDQDTLVHRLLHLFLRAQGSSLDWNTVKLLCLHIERSYSMPRL